MTEARRVENYPSEEVLSDETPFEEGLATAFCGDSSGGPCAGGRTSGDLVEGSGVDDLAPMFRALGDPTRLRLLLTLLGGELCVGHLAQRVGASESSVSHHLRHLRQLSLVRRRRQGQMFFYSLDDDHVEAILRMGLDHQAHEKGR